MCLVIAILAALVAYGQDGLKRVSKADALSAATAKVNPEYPAMARQLRLEGVVELEAVINETGTVTEVNVVSGNPLLTKNAALALKRWKFAPFLENAKPVKVVAPVSISFKM